MADINFKQPKVFSWEDHRENQKLDDKKNPLYYDLENNETTSRTDKPVIVGEKYQRTELVSGARIVSSAAIVSDGKPAQKIRVELKFADGVATHAVDLVIAKDVFDGFEDDIQCLQSALNSNFTIS